MRFALHRKFRYDTDWTERQYLKAVQKYYKYLDSIEYLKGRDLIKYFGDSFFHEGRIEMFKMDLIKARIEMSIYRDSDREDINNIRKEQGLKSISPKTYQTDPIIYKCLFFGVNNISASTDFSRIWSENEIMDTEITYDRKRNNYLVSIIFWEEDQLSFRCNYSTVHIVNKNRIAELTGNRINRMPFCEHCKRKMLSKDVIKSTLKEVEIKLGQKE